MPLTPEQTIELESLIRARREALDAEIRGEVSRSRDESFGALAGPVTDSADEATADLLSDIDQAEVTRDLAEVRALEAAQERLAAGRYGSCEVCGAEIEFERLRANPAALRCVACQRVREKTYAHPAEPKL
jgi:RNA polymerase-binding transcription factor DksA